MGRRIKDRPTLTIEGHRLVTVSLAPDDIQWLKIGMAQCGSTRSEIIRAAIKQLRAAVHDDPATLFQATYGGSFPSPDRALAVSLGQQPDSYGRS